MWIEINWEEVINDDARSEWPALVKYQMVNGMVLINPSASSSTAMESDSRWGTIRQRLFVLALNFLWSLFHNRNHAYKHAENSKHSAIYRKSRNGDDLDHWAVGIFTIGLFKHRLSGSGYWRYRKLCKSCRRSVSYHLRGTDSLHPTAWRSE